MILFDELGRGTATYDGMALAQSIIEYIHDRTGAKTLFATHYHELTALSETLTRLENVHVATLERDGQVTFLHKIEPGPADKSYGIHVAKIAGLPEELLKRADAILTKLEGQAQQVPLADTTPKRKCLRRLLNKCPSLRRDRKYGDHRIEESGSLQYDSHGSHDGSRRIEKEIIKKGVGKELQYKKVEKVPNLFNLPTQLQQSGRLLEVQIKETLFPST